LHHRREAPLVESHQLLGPFNHHAHLVVVLAAGQAGAVSGRAHFDQKDRRRRKGRDPRHPLMMPDRRSAHLAAYAGLAPVDRRSGCSINSATRVRTGNHWLENGTAV
jgi:hypothetical protein